MRDPHIRTTDFGKSREGAAGIVRAAQNKDAAALTRIMPLAFTDGSEEQMQYRSSDALRLMILGFQSATARSAWFTFLVAEVDGRTVGAAVFRYGLHSNDPFMPPLYNDIGILDTLAVDPEYRNVGVGRALVRRAEADMRNAGARVMGLQCPIEAARFYDRCGYHVEAGEVACATFFPRQGQRVFTMSRPVSEPETRLAWRSLTGARPLWTPYTHPSRSEPAMMMRGLIPGDHNRFKDWPEPEGFRLAKLVGLGGAS